jgi:TPP-dependent pyruvate/acetoin dehydrogenase alpha subunit
MNITNAKMISMYKFMYLSRKFEEKAEVLNKEKRSLGSIHPSVGEEATAVGVSSVLRKDDILSPSYRDMGALFAKGMTPLELMGMLFGKQCGATEGRTRLLHVGDLDRSILPANPILGASTAIAIGAALAFKKQNADRIVINMFGDGASNEGAVHEAMNFASVFKLPIVFVIVNNHYAWSTPTEKIVKISTLADRAKAYGFPGYIANGNDILDVYEVVGRAAENARQGMGPSLVECRTYRVGGHSGNDKNVYRSQEEIVQWKQDCPIEKFEKYLKAIHVLTEEEVEQIKQEVVSEIEDAVTKSEASPYPDPKKAMDLKTMLYIE